jgi:hypothetical protein
MLRLIPISQEDDRHISGTIHDNCAPTFWDPAYKTVQKDPISFHNHEIMNVIPVRQISASIQQSNFIEDEIQRKQRTIDHAHDAQENIHLSLASPYLHRHILIPPVFATKTIVSSYSKNTIEEQGIHSYLRCCSPHACYDYQSNVQCPITSTDQHQAVYQDIHLSNDLSFDSALSSNCIFIYADGTAGRKGNTTQYNKDSGKKPKSAKKRKPKDQPKRPLSAYNLFFQQERQKILSNIPDIQISNQPFQRKRTRPKIPHGKIGFESLAKVIGQRWQSLDAKQIGYYKGLAMQEMIRYKEAMKVFRRKNEMKAEATATPRNVLSAVNNLVNTLSTTMEENDKCPCK